VIFFPRTRANWLPDGKDLGDVSFFVYVVKSGRAVLYPVYQETYERRATNVLPSASQGVQITVQRDRDFAR
jgi:hypothetical protein